MKSSRPTEAEFEELKRQRDEGIERFVREARKSLWPDIPDDAPLDFHSRNYKSGCYCACPNGPCQHEFDGWREFDGGRGSEQVCRRCGEGAMSHSMRCAE